MIRRAGLCLLSWRVKRLDDFLSTFSFFYLSSLFWFWKRFGLFLFFFYFERERQQESDGAWCKTFDDDGFFGRLLEIPHEGVSVGAIHTCSVWPRLWSLIPG
jgi:hypothetical protein